MTTQERKVFNKLKKIGIAVREPMEWDNNGHYGVFWIDCEQAGENDKTFLHADYYGKFWGSDILNETLDEAGLYFEWVNAAYASCRLG
tara:strand:- start:2863 stop:3126 length:264 start_codon:yes stop_codon:yes gene_type:complete